MSKSKKIVMVSDVKTRPWMVKTYRFNPTVDVNAIHTPQVKALCKAMIAKGDNATFTGPELARFAVEQGFLKTRQDPALIFAYYARAMEDIGLELVS